MGNGKKVKRLLETLGGANERRLRMGCGGTFENFRLLALSTVAAAFLTTVRLFQCFHSWSTLKRHYPLVIKENHCYIFHTFL